MCDKVYAEFACADKHEARGEDRSRLKHIQKCVASRGGATCNDNAMELIHDTNQDNPDEACPECRGETPPETP
jgi:hypothetical protein